MIPRLKEHDRALFEAVARLSVPSLDAPLRRASDFADFSKPWFLTAGALVLFGGARERRAAVTGLSAIGATSLLVNQPLKRLTSERSRPDRAALGVPVERWVKMPTSRSFPSGHSASAAAFAVSVGRLLPALRLPLRAAASVVAFSRVYTGVHYPSDVLVGVTIGALIGHLAARLAERRHRVRQH
ncbi:phosphatase PAP2 family protein [Kribbella sp. NPDC048915]|uniref:phosphatase PAP2 family protein n=1 Tax=Kribbella sp. NPDC048915 TaxID=3155148 RepID=UPI0033DE7188